MLKWVSAVRKTSPRTSTKAILPPLAKQSSLPTCSLFPRYTPKGLLWADSFRSSANVDIPGLLCCRMRGSPHSGVPSLDHPLLA